MNDVAEFVEAIQSETATTPEVQVQSEPQSPLTIVVKPDFPLLPSGHVFLGGGDLNAKYEAFLDQLFTQSITALDKDAVEARKVKGKSISQKTIQGISRLQTLVSLSDLLASGRTLKFKLVGIQLSKKLDFQAVLLNYLTKHQFTLQAMKVYL